SRTFRRKRSLCQLPLAVNELHEHARAVVDASRGAGLEIINRVRADQIFGVDDGLAQRLAELWRARLRAGRERALGGVEANQPAVERVRAERPARRLVVGLLVGGLVVERDLADRVRLRELARHHHRPGWANGAFDRGAADTHEVWIDQRMGAVDLPLVAAFG